MVVRVNDPTIWPALLMPCARVLPGESGLDAAGSSRVVTV